jgi:glycosyltransferase involved in cell wall biosynthesis
MAIREDCVRPAVTVLIDTYNHERFIEEAIVSVLAQDFPRHDVEIVVVDDGSSDRTPEIIVKFEPRVRLIRKANGGQASAFNAGISEARGEIIAFLDGDDWWKKNKLSVVVKAFEENPSVGVVGHGIIQVDSDSGESSILQPDALECFDMRSTQGAQTFRNLMCFLGTSRVAIRKSVLEAVLPIPESLVIEADEFMSAVAIAAGSALLLTEPLTFYRLHDQNLFQFRGNDTARLRRKTQALDSLAGELAVRLASLGISSEAISIVVEPIRVGVARANLLLDGGWPWETYRVERADLRHSYGQLGMGYRGFKELALATTLLMSPRAYYRLRNWYAAKGLRRWRKFLGEPTPKALIVERRVEAGDGFSAR